MTPYQRWHCLESKHVPHGAGLEPEEIAFMLDLYPKARMLVLVKRTGGGVAMPEFNLCALLDKMVYGRQAAYWLECPAWKQGRWVYANEVAAVFWVAGGGS